MRMGQIAGVVGQGLAAGLVGMAAMTVSGTLEAKVRHRQASTAAAKVLGGKPASERSERRFNNLVHWGYRTGWGAARGLLGAAGLARVPATVAHLGAVWGGEQVVLPARGASPPAWRWEKAEVGIDLSHHVVYVSATGLALSWLERP